MINNRLNDFIKLDKKETSSLFAPFDSSLTILDSSLIDDSMSNSGYVVITNKGKYLLKLYSNTTDKVETAVYSYLKDKINVPELLYYDGSKQSFEYAFVIMEYLECSNLKYYIQANNEYKINIAYEIGKMCSVIHSRKYRHDALLDQGLNERKIIPATHEHILQLLSDKAGTYLKPETAKKVYDFIKANPDLFERINAESVLCHGDFCYGNIMIAYEKVYFIDFEFAHSGSIYHDIGKFFRRKSDDVQALIGDHIYNAFAEGYNSVSLSPLPSDWPRLAHLCDIDSMLNLLNRENVPIEWVLDIEYDILCAIK